MPNELKAYGSGVVFDYLSFKLMDYDRTQLENDDSPIATIILTCQDKEIARQKGKAFDIKRRLIRNLFSKGFDKDVTIASLEFIDWAIGLKDEDILWREVKQMREVKNVPYVMSFERIAMKEGIKEGSLLTLKEVILETLSDKFGEIPTSLFDILNQIEDKDKLKVLNRLAIKCTSLEEYKDMLHEKV